MKIDEIIKLQIIPTSGYELEPDQLVPTGDWSPTSDGRYERSGLVKDIIGTSIRMRRQAATKYTVVVLANNNNWGTTTGSGDYNPGETAVIGAIPNTGYRFTQWQDGNTQMERRVQVNSNMNYIANFEREQITYTIRVAVKSGQGNMGTVSGGGTGLESGSTVDIQATPNTGYKFVRWDDGNTSAERTVQVNGDKTYTAEFAIINYTIRVKSNNTTWGTVSGGGAFLAGTTTTIKATANSGYRFVRWNDGNNSATRTITVNGDATYTAIFEAIPATTATIIVKSSNPEMGTTNPSGTNVFNIGDTILIQAISNPGFIFKRWVEDGSTNPIIEYYVSGDKSFTAEFDRNESDQCIVYTSSEPRDGGTTRGQGTYRRGTQCRIEAYPADGYVFVHWNINGVEVEDNPYIFTIEDNMTCVAVFKKKSAQNNSWDVFIKSGELWIENEETHEQQPLNRYGEMQGDTLYFDATALSSISEGGFTMSYTAKVEESFEEITITNNGVYADFNTDDRKIESIITVTDMRDGDTSTAKYAIKILTEEQRDEVTQRYLNGDPNWWKLEQSVGGGDEPVGDSMG